MKCWPLGYSWTIQRPARKLDRVQALPLQGQVGFAAKDADIPSKMVKYHTEANDYGNNAKRLELPRYPCESCQACPG